MRVAIFKNVIYRVFLEAAFCQRKKDKKVNVRSSNSKENPDHRLDVTSVPRTLDNYNRAELELVSITRYCLLCMPAYANWCTTYVIIARHGQKGKKTKGGNICLEPEHILFTEDKSTPGLGTHDKRNASLS